jgi:hypothetical protein
LGDDGTDAVSWNWSGPSGFSDTIRSPKVFPPAAGAYVVIVTDARGCSASDTAVVSLKTIPSLSATQQGLACAGDTVRINGTGPDQLVWSWTGPGGFTSNEDSVTIFPGVEGAYIASVTDTNGCVGYDTVRVNAQLDIIVFNDGPHCEGDIVRFYVKGVEPGFSYEWSMPSGFVSFNQNPVVSPAEAGDHIVRVTAPSGCFATDTTTVCVSRPSANCTDEVDLYLNESGAALLYPDLLNVGSSGGECGGLASMSVSQPEFYCEHIGETAVQLTVTDSIGCVESCTSTVTISDTTAPMASCEALEDLIVVWSGTEIFPANLAPQSGDNCSDGALEYSFEESFSQRSLMVGCREQLGGIIDLTVFIRDAYGNVSSCVVSQPVPPAGPGAEDCSCDGESLILNEDIATDDYKAEMTITSAGEVFPGDTVLMKAGQSVTLQPGFYAMAGSQFAARIDSCGVIVQPGAELGQGLIGSREASDVSEVTPTSVFGANGLQVWPNPYRRFFTVSIEVNRDVDVNLMLNSMSGGHTQKILMNQRLTVGTSQVTIDGSQVPPGVYILTVLAEGERISTKIVSVR